MKIQLIIQFILTCILLVAYTITAISVFIKPCDIFFKVLFAVGFFAPTMIVRESWRELKSEMNCYNKTILYKNEKERK